MVKKREKERKGKKRKEKEREAKETERVELNKEQVANPLYFYRRMRDILRRFVG